MYVFFNVNLSGERKRGKIGRRRRASGMNLYECSPGGREKLTLSEGVSDMIGVFKR